MYNIGTLSDNIAACLNQCIEGVGQKAYLYNIQDIDKDLTTVTDLTIDTIYTVPGGSRWECEVVDNGIDASTKLVKGPYRNGFDHNLIVRIFANDTDNRLRMYELLAGRIVAVFETFTDTGSIWQVAGFELGLEVVNLEANWVDAETAGGWIIELGCDDQCKEKDIPYLLKTVVPITAPITINVHPFAFTDTSIVDGMLPVSPAHPIPYPIFSVVVDPAGVATYYAVQKITDLMFKVYIGSDLPPGDYQINLISVEGSTPVAGSLNYYSGTFDESDPSAGILTINTTISLTRPLNIYIKDTTGLIERYDIKKVSGSQHVVNIGEELRPGTYEYWILYV